VSFHRHAAPPPPPRSQFFSFSPNPRLRADYTYRITTTYRTQTPYPIVENDLPSLSLAITPATPYDGIYQPSAPGAATSIPRVASTVPAGATAGPMYLVNQVATLGRWVLAPNADGSAPVAFSNTTLPFPPLNGWGMSA
jgi:hypothetical protein